MWSPKTGCGVVFPYPKSKHTEFRVTMKKGESPRRVSVRHGAKQLFAFAAGTSEESKATPDQERAYKRALEQLTSVRTALDVEITRIQAEPMDAGYHSLVLTDTNYAQIKYQAFDQWLPRLTTDQLRFVTSQDARPQRVEGPAGTGKTLCLLLRAFHLCRQAEEAGSEFRVLFVAHSDATRNATSIQLDSLGPPFFHQRERNTTKRISSISTSCLSSITSFEIPIIPAIIFSIDRSQAPGERGITTRLVREMLTQSDEEETETRTQVVFRCSPAIVNLAEAVTSAGATLFTTFENPLVDATSIISATDDELAQEPIYWSCRNDQNMCKFALSRAEELRGILKCPSSDILLIATTDALVPLLCETLDAERKRFVQILHRGDLELVHQGAKSGAYIVSHPDFVGGLEFKAVLIVGVDEGRLPPSEGVVKEESKHFVEFKACNRLYVAITRARLAVELFWSNERGKSSILEHARAVGVITDKDST